MTVTVSERQNPQKSHLDKYFQCFLFDEEAVNVTGMRVRGENTWRSVSILIVRIEKKTRRKAEMATTNSK